MVRTMKCPDCRAPDYYVGFMGANCIRPGCKNFKNGTHKGVPVLLPSAPRLFRTGDPVWVDRGQGWDGVPDGFLIAAVLQQVYDDDSVMVELVWESPSKGGDVIPDGFQWWTDRNHLQPRKA